ncbi:MAG TPA: hypothetical protein VIL28_01330 [Steroidobacteraceae bacterium]
MKTPKNSMWLTCFACLFLWVAAHASAQVRLIENAIEVSTDEILLPGSVPGRLTFRECKPPCRNKTLDVNAQTQFLVGGTKVSLAEFKQYISRTGSQFLMVFHEPGGSVTRLIVFGELEQ